MGIKQWVAVVGFPVFLSSCASFHSATNDASGQSTNDQAFSQLSLESLFKEKALNSKSPKPIRWLSGGDFYVRLEKNDAVKGRDIVRYAANGQDRTLLVEAKALIPTDEEKPLSINNYFWSKDQKKLLIYTNSKKVWRSNSRGDYWLFDRETGQLTQLGQQAGKDYDPSSMMFAKLSPNGEQLAYVQNNNLFVQDLSSFKVRQLTFSTKPYIVNGATDWVYEEEFGLADGFRWNPTGESIAYWQFNTERVKTFTMIDNTSELYPTLQQFPYPKAGEQNAIVRVGVLSLKTGKTDWVPVPAETDDFYLPRMSWNTNGSQLLVQKMNRLQNTNTHYLFNPSNLRIKPILVERDEAFLEGARNVHWLKQSDGFLKITEEDGWRHVYRVSATTGEKQNLTLGNFDIVSLVHVDETNGWLYFTAPDGAPTESYLFKAPLNHELSDAERQPQRLTPAQWKGSNRYRIADNGKIAMHTHSAFRVPPSHEIIELPTHKTVQTLEDNSALKEKISQLPLADVEFFQVPSYDGLLLDGYLMKPHNFNPKKKYPLIFYVYGEPAGQTAKNSWGGSRSLWHDYLTTQGFLVASIDNRGTKSPRGRDWRKQIYRRIGTLAAKDQMSALDEMSKRWTFIDRERVGIWGHSGGGSMTLNMLFRHPEAYKAGVAVAPVADVRLYDTIYQERYMGLPDTFEVEKGVDAYNASSPIHYAKHLEGNLLLVHGTGDDNVHYQATERLVDELVKYNKMFDFMAYPNRTHSVREGEGTSLHLRTKMTEFFKRHLQP